MSKNSDLIDRISRGLKASLLARVIYIGSNSILIILLSRFLLGPEGFGLLFFALSILSSASLLAALGLPKSTARYVNEFVEKDETQVRYIIRRSLVYLGILIGLVSVSLVLVSDPLARLLGEPAIAPFFVVGAGYVVVYSLNSHVSLLFQGFNRITWSAATTSISGIGRLLFSVVFIVAGFGAIGALIGYTIGYALAVVVGAVVLYNEYYAPFDEARRPEPGLSRRMLEYSIPLTATKGAGVLDKRVDTILIGALLNATAVGFYVVAKQISEVVSAPASSFGFTLSPTYGEQKASDQIARAARIYEEALTYILLLYIPATVGLILVAGPTVRFIFGDDYASAIPVVQVFSGFVLVNAVNKITTDGLDYLGRARERAILKGATAVANFLLNLLLIPLFGVVGAAVATVITYTVYTGGNVYYIHKELSFQVTRIIKDTTIISGITVGMAATVILLLPYISGLLSLFGVVFFGMCVWGVLSALSGLVNFQRVRAFLF